MSMEYDLRQKKVFFRGYKPQKLTLFVFKKLKHKLTTYRQISLLQTTTHLISIAHKKKAIAEQGFIRDISLMRLRSDLES